MSVKITKVGATTAPANRPGRTVTLNRYAVLIDGVEVGQVFQHRAETMTAYSGRAYGHASHRTMWAWEADNMGMTELDTREAAIEDMLSMVEIAGREA